MPKTNAVKHSRVPKPNIKTTRAKCLTLLVLMPMPKTSAVKHSRVPKLKNMKTKEAILDLFSLNNQKVYSMPQIDSWLLKYKYLYQQLMKLQSHHNIVALKTITKLSSFSVDNNLFMIIYHELETVSGFHSHENYFKQELKQYHKIKSSKTAVKKWVQKNESLGAEIFVRFQIDYFDYNTLKENLKVLINPSEKLEIHINHKDFVNTIEFLDIFNELYWMQEILPDSIDKIIHKFSYSSN